MTQIYIIMAVAISFLVSISQTNAQTFSGCHTLDWEIDCNGNPFQEGFYVTADAYSCLGITITNNLPGNFPIVLFNSNNPSGEDEDLGTPSSNCPTCTNPCPGQSNDPNGGLTNCSPAGLTLITEENPVDANGDGLEDDPDDHFNSLYEFCFAAPVTISSLNFLDDSNGFLHFTLADGTMVTHNLIGGLDNDQFSQTFNVSDVMCMEVEYTTSGALAAVNFCFDTPNAPMCDLTPAVLGADVEVCEGTDPGVVEIITPAMSSISPITYEWQQSLVGCNGGFGAIPGATGPTYNPGPLVQDTYIKLVVMTNDGTQVCIEDSNCITYSVTNNPSVTLREEDDLCDDGAPIVLEVSPEGGTFSGTGITDAVAGIFDPSVAGVGSYVVTYNFSSGACSGSAQITIVVEECCPTENCFGATISRN